MLITISGASSMGPREKVGMGSEGEGLRNLGFWVTHRVVAQVMKLRRWENGENTRNSGITRNLWIRYYSVITNKLCKLFNLNQIIQPQLLHI